MLRSSGCSKGTVLSWDDIAGGDAGDAELMGRVQAGDSEAFGALYDRLAGRAYRVAIALVRDPSRVEDVVQEAFLSVWRNRASYRPDHGTVVAWTMGTVRNRAVDSLRHHGRHDSRRAGDDHIEERLAALGSVEETIGERDRAARLRTTVRGLPDAQRDVIALAYFGELSMTEIASELAVPVGTVKSRMRLGLDKLRAGVPA